MMPGSLLVNDDPFASLLGGDPFEAALQDADRDCRWLLGSPRSRRADAKYASDDDDEKDVVPLFTHARIAAEKARTRSASIRVGIKISTLFGWLIHTGRDRHGPSKGSAKRRI